MSYQPYKTTSIKALNQQYKKIELEDLNKQNNFSKKFNDSSDKNDKLY